MTVSARTNAPATESAQQPYAAPQGLSQVRPRNVSGAPQPLVPFVPREFRNRTSVGDVTHFPAAQHVAQRTPDVGNADALQSGIANVAEPEREGANGVGNNNDWNSQSVTMHFGAPGSASNDAFEVTADAAPDQEDFSATFDADSDADVVHDDVELPWIDAFAEDGQEPEETWPMGEAGRRLDELTESLSSLDASRARKELVDSSDAPRAPDASLPMWNEDEWIDIMPTSAAPTPPVAEESSDSRGDVEPKADIAPTGNAVPGSELAARALESLAQRIRAGDVQVPEAQPEVAQEALLAGVLASMLGWRRP